MSRRSYRILVGVLYSGEAEYPQCLQSIQAQIGVNATPFTISGRQNKEAHDELYAEFMRNADGFDFFFKLDADMTIREQTGLESLVNHASKNDAAHVMSYVLDKPSGLAIPGVQMFKSDSRWEGSADTLNVDYPPKVNGKSILLTRPVYVNHMASPNDYQLFRYGIHKTLKSIQSGRYEKKSMQKFLLHTAILNGMSRNHSAGRGELMWALIGARLAFDGQIPGDTYHSEEIRSIFDHLRDDPERYRLVADAALNFFSSEIQTLFVYFSKYRLS